MTSNLGDLSEVACAAYFYCDFRKSELQEPVNVIGSLVAQLCSQVGRYPDELEIAYDRSSNMPGQRRRPSLSVLQHVLQVFAEKGKLILLVDAVDECNCRKDIIEFISSLTQTIQHVNILITSRDELDIREAFHVFTRVRMENQLENMDGDIRNYIDSRLQSDPKLQWLNPSIRATIASSLNARSAGM